MKAPRDLQGFALSSALITAAALLALGGCSSEDTGQCCTALAADAKMFIPVPDRPAGSMPRDIIREHPKFECDELLCTSYQGSEPVCTRPCNESKPCSSGFECKPIIVSDPGPDATIRPGDTFCVRKTCTTAKDCPGGFNCEDTYTGMPLTSASGIGQCVLPAQKCPTAK
ncbi:MAG: hypothetical protein U1E65_33110 [Myxococcota bacterium]